MSDPGFRVAPQEYDPAIPLDTITEHPDNYNQADDEALAASLDEFGFYGGILVQKSTRRIVIGHGRYRNARAKGATTLPGFLLDISDEDALRMMPADNQTGRLAVPDESRLVALLQQAQDSGRGLPPGFTETRFAELVAKLNGSPQRRGDEDEVPEAPEAPVTGEGDIWHLGPHRLLCGDATDRTSVKRMLDGDRCDCMWTDPPYGVSYVGKTRRSLTMRNDGADDLAELLRGAWAVAGDALKPGAPFYIAHPPGPLSRTFGESVAEAGWLFRQGLVWVKNTMVLGHSDYHFSHEPIMFGYLPGASRRRGRGGGGWYGDDSQTSVFMIDKPRRSESHPTMKPVELITRHLANSSPPGGLVYDPFDGSGSTIIAAHILGRVVRAAELDPAYCDVIVERFRSYTGIEPVRVAAPHPVV